MVRVGTVLGVAMSLVLGGGAAAYAGEIVPNATSFSVSYVHNGGAGATAIRATGGLDWLNRSVVLKDLRVYIKSGHCGHASFMGWSPYEAYVDVWDTPELCSGTGVWWYFGDVLLDASEVYGGIREIDIYVYDHTHNAVEWAIVCRATCYTSP
jgi:hypothetical protein